MIPDLESLNCFEAAASAPSFRAAAARVHLSPAAFGERIKRLEEDLGEKLFQRTTRKVALTAAGRRLVGPAKRLLEEAASLKARIASGGSAAPFQLTIGTRFELGLSWLVANLSGLAAKRPERTIHLAFGDTTELLGQLRSGATDAIVSSARLATPGLRHAALHREDYAFVAAPSLLKARPFDRSEDAAEHVLLDAHPDLPLFRYFLDGAPPEATFSFNKVELLGTIAAIKARVLEGAGVAVLPAYFVEAELKRKQLRPLLPKIRPSHDHFRLVYPADHPAEAEILLLAGELRAIPLS